MTMVYRESRRQIPQIPTYQLEAFLVILPLGGEGQQGREVGKPVDHEVIQRLLQLEKLGVDFLLRIREKETGQNYTDRADSGNQSITRPFGAGRTSHRFEMHFQ